ncbi:MAG TPA: N-acetyltransferase, partial [Rhodospirillales bacterium]|nr:N-acetyltransferase [Rhodospirillales bacterium]
APIWSSRRRPPDSRLSPDQTIARQFDQLRVSDNYRYPAFFEHRGHRYKVQIEKMRLDPAEWADEYEDAVSIQLHDGGKMAPGGMKFSEKLADQGEVRLRPAVEEDGLLLHKWQSYKFTRLYFRHPSKPTLDEHWKWFHECLHDPERHLNIILYNDERAGALRLDRVSDGIFETSILVSPRFYNKGIATAALKLIRRIWPKSTFRAEVFPGNIASHLLFQKCGYQPQVNHIYISIPEDD